MTNSSFRLMRAAVLAVALTAASGVHAQEPIADITVGYVVPYLPEDLTSQPYAMTIKAGENGAPDVIEIGMIFRIVDADDPSLTAIAQVTGNVGDGTTVSTTDFVATFIGR